MSIKEIFLGGSGALVVMLTLVQITPVKINPWSAIFGWIGKQFNGELLKRISGIEKDIVSMKDDIQAIKDDNKETYAKDCRVRILRFADEIYIGQQHSQDHYRQILMDVTAYENYCEDHPEFENQVCLSSIQLIKDSFDSHLRNHDFLTEK